MASWIGMKVSLSTSFSKVFRPAFPALFTT